MATTYASDPHTCTQCWGIVPPEGVAMVPDDGEICRCDFDPDFDHVYLIDGLGTITDAEGVYAPSVENDPAGDVTIDGGPTLAQSRGSFDVNSGWDVLTGHTGQHGYNGAVMHPSEQWGNWAIQDLIGYVEEDGYVAFAVVEVRDEEGDYPSGDAIGWVVVYRVIRTS